MKSLLFVFFSLFCFNLGFSQTDKEDTLKIEDFVDVEAEPPGGFVKFYEYITKNISFPKSFKGGTFKVEIIVNKAGFLKVTSISPNNNKEINDQIIKVFNNSPRWKPAKVNDKYVNCRFIIPIQFKN